MQFPEIGTGVHCLAGFGEPGKPFRQTVRETAEAGYKHLLLLFWEGNPGIDASGDAPQAFVNGLESNKEALLRTLASHGVQVSAIYPGFGLMDLENTQKTIDQMLRYRDLAWSLGCHRMVHCMAQSKTPTAPLDDERRRDIRALAKILDAVTSDKPGEVFKTALDIHYWGTVETIADAEYFAEVSEKASSGFCINMGHLTTSEQPGWTLLERFPERVHVMAWKDHSLAPGREKPVVSRELGQADTPFPKYVEAWRKNPIDALQIIAVEDVEHEQRLEAMRRSRLYLEQLWSK